MESQSHGLDLEKELTCSICTEVLYQPLTLLDCLHTFCGSCLKEWFRWQHTSQQSSPNPVPAGSSPYTCPSCRAAVRATRNNATVTTLLEMFLAANPDKGRTAEEKEEMKKKYTPGEDVLPKIEERAKSLRQRRAEDEDRRLVDEVRLLSLREVGVESSEARRERRRREDGRSRARSNREGSRDSRHTGERERRLRRETDPEGRRVRDDPNLRPTDSSGDERRRRRSGERSRRQEEDGPVHQIEHQSSLRSLLSTSDIDPQEMEEEILRQIREEGLLDGIDLENLDVNQEDQISERIADAFRRRQEEKKRQERARRREGSRNRVVSGEGPILSAPEPSAEDRIRAARRQRTHSRTSSMTSQGEIQSRPPQAASASMAAHLDVPQGPGTRQRRRTTSGDRSSALRAISSGPQTRPASRSQTDLSDRPRLSQVANSSAARSSTEPIQRPQEIDPSPREQQHRQNSDGNRTRVRSEDTSAAPSTRTAPQVENNIPAALSLSSQIDRTLIPAPLSPRHSPHSSISDRAFAFSSASRPTSSSSATNKHRSQLYPEPSITCSKCAKTHIEYELHYNCRTCRNGNWNICLSCYRSGGGCLYWFGFGYAAWSKWENLKQTGKLGADADPPHMLTANRYIPPKVTPGGADGRKTLTNDDPEKRLQSGAFCSNCFTWANECYWRCDFCNEGDWGFCNNCVNQGKSCTHSLLPLTYKPSESRSPPLSPIQAQPTPSTATILTGPGIIDFGPFKPLTFSTRCDNCHHPIPPLATRYHCYSCTSAVPNTQRGDYDICSTCYTKFETSRRISPENGANGWRRCLQGHRMVVVGFEDIRGGQCRVIVKDLVGGRGLHEESCTQPDLNAMGIQKWSWADGTHMRLATTDVSKTAPTSATGMSIEKSFPPDGGVGMKCLALWSWYRNEEADDELLFPKGADIMEVKDVNGDWYHGTYMGQRGLFPAPYVRPQSNMVGN
ncbi:hypothetical protein F5884DRAFT_95932 [Xylogone sp. PMI_703]|nr:hypothetical protein F5884DRAFT_95932 [Xylogone sp. PMI_703]